MTAIYEKHGLQFMYPENWKLTESPESEMPYQVSMETPNGAIWSVNVFPADAVPDELLDEAIEGLQETYEDVEISEAESDFADFPSKAIDAYFYCLDFMVIAKIRTISTSDYQLVFLFQAESRDFEAQHEVFRAITMSLLQSLQE